jgi:molecular chaperone GrpE
MTDARAHPGVEKRISVVTLGLMADPKDESGEEEKQPSGPEVAPAEGSGGEEELKRKTDEAKANFERYLRAVADGENLKKRLQREKSDAVRFANEAFARDLLQVIDSLELALEHAELGGNGKSVVEGVELTLRLFRDVLERHGVKEIGDPTGAAFDPATQEAAEVEAGAEVTPNTVLRRRSKGYLYNDRLLRPARVVVATGAPVRGAGNEQEE